MLSYYFASLMAILALGLSQLLFWPLLPVVWGAARQVKPKEIYLLAFIVGLIHDLVWAKPLGIGSLFLVTLCLLTIFLQSRFKSPNGIFLLVLILGQMGYLILSHFGLV